MYQKLWSNDVQFLRYRVQQMDGQMDQQTEGLMDGWKKWHMNVGAPPKNKDKTISNDARVVEEFSSVFENAIKSLNISPRNLTLGDTTNFSNPLETATKKFENNLSVQIIKEHICVDQEFDFEQLKLVSTIFYQIFIFSPNDSPSKTMKNVICFI